MAVDIEALLADPNNLINLSERDEAALRYWQRTKTAPIEEKKAAEMFALYLRGYDCEDIRRANKGFGLGAIVHARIVWKWDLGLEEYRTKLRQGIVDKVATSSLESVHLVSDLLAANNRRLRDRLTKYLMSGSDDDLPITISSVREYKGLVETLQLLTKPQTTKHEHHHVHEGAEGAGPERAQSTTAEPSQSEALALLAGDVPAPLVAHEIEEKLTDK